MPAHAGQVRESRLSRQWQGTFRAAGSLKAVKTLSRQVILAFTGIWAAKSSMRGLSWIGASLLSVFLRNNARARNLRRPTQAGISPTKPARLPATKLHRAPSCQMGRDPLTIEETAHGLGTGSEDTRIAPTDTHTSQGARRLMKFSMAGAGRALIWKDRR